MRALITGVQGFVGKYLANHLLSQGIEVWGTSRKESPFLCLENGNVEVIKNDLDSTEKILDLLNTVKPDYIFHLAGQSNVKKSWEDKAGTFYANVNKTIFLLDACVEYQKIKPEMTLLTVGSAEEYGKVEPQELPIKETTPLRPMSPYGASKAAVSMLVQQYHKAHGLNVIHTRPFNHIGPEQSEGFVVPDFIKQIIKSEKDKELNPEIKVGNLSAARDFLDVRDIVVLYTKLIMSKNISGEIFNICSGKKVMINTILNKLLEMSESNIIVNIDSAKYRPIEIEEYYGDNSKIFDLIGTHELMEIEETLKDTFDNEWKDTI